MICNVCGNEKRCYLLMENADKGPFATKMDGMVFGICTECLSDLIAPVKTKKTTLDNPSEPPSKAKFRQRIGRRLTEK